MRYFVLILFLLISLPVSAQNTVSGQTASHDKAVLIRDIVMEGFVLQDKNQFVKLFKPYRNKHLTASDMDMILQAIDIMYEREGYQGLVSISYQVIKHRLVYTALMVS